MTEVEVEVGGECEDDNHECVSRDRQEEEQASLRRVALRQVREEPPEEIQD